MSALLAPLAALALGWGLRRRLPLLAGFPGPLAGSALAGIAALLLWMAALDVAGVRWTAGWLLAPVVPALLLGLLRPAAPRTGAGRPWSRWATAAAAAAAAAAARAATVLAVPAFGWDFRYIWGLKARVFALAGAHDLAWLAAPGHAFAHPAYPPAWSDLVAAGIACGADAGAAAAAWSALLALALAATCWELAAGAPPAARALAAAAAAWSPVLLDPRGSGYAEPLLAFLAAVGLGALSRLAAADRRDAAALAVAAALLALAKNEGAALAVALGVAAVATAGLARALPALAATGVAVLAWRGALPAGLAAAAADFAPSPAAMAGHAEALPGALVAATARTPTIAAVLAAWGVVVFAWQGRALRPVRLACGLWALAVCAAYLATTADLTWHLATSADRVLAVPLPALLALAVAARFSGPPPAAAPPAPGSPRGE